MDEYLTTVEVSKIWGISSRRIALLCSENRVSGAIKKGKTWLIPCNAEKPKLLKRGRKADVDNGK